MIVIVFKLKKLLKKLKVLIYNKNQYSNFLIFELVKKYMKTFYFFTV